MKTIISVFLISVFLIVSCTGESEKDSVNVTLQNPVEVERIDQYVEIDLTKLRSAQENENAVVMINGEEIASQIVGQNKIGFVTDFKPMEEKIVTVKFGKPLSNAGYQNRTYAEIAMKVDYEMKEGKYLGGEFKTFERLRLPDDHTDHNALFKYEGPGWESEKVGYRMYIDWRNRIDIFGKKINELVLYDVGIDDRDAQDDSYHNMQDWGMDVLKVGNTLGLGSFAMYENDSFVSVETRDSVFVEITENGPVLSEVTVDYYGWEVAGKKYDLTAALSIAAGSRLTKTDLQLTGNPESIITGFAKHENTEFFQKVNENGWSYIALYGEQSLSGDDLGLAVLYNQADLIEQTEDEENYIVELLPAEGNVEYYFCAAWQQEPDGIKTIDEFQAYLEQISIELNNPINIVY